MTHQWTPPPQRVRPGGGGGGNGLLYALIGLVAVLIVIVGIVVALALGVGRPGDSELVATPAPPAPAADDGRPDPTGDAASDADADARPIDVGSGSQDWGSQCPDAGSSSWYPICDDCFEHPGPGYSAHTGSPSTSCAFASNVAEAIHLSIAGQTPTPRTVTVQADSPVTGQTYTMSCVLENRSGTDATYHCTGGNNAVVFVGMAG